MSPAPSPIPAELLTLPGSLAQLGSAVAAPRPHWPASWWTGMATSLGLHSTLALAAFGWGAGWVVVLYPPRNDVSSSAQRRGAAIVVQGEFARPDDASQSPVPVKLVVAAPAVDATQRTSAAAIARQSPPTPAQERDFEPLETSLAAAHTPPATAAQRAHPREESPPAASAQERAMLPRTARGSAPSLAGTFDSRAARGTKNNAPPRAIYSPDPLYPPELLAARQTGRVLLRVRIVPAGKVSEAVIHQTSGQPAFDRAALEAVRQWRFEPLAGAPAAGIEAIVPVRFEIAAE